jgi:hypothetical protein
MSEVENNNLVDFGEDHQKDMGDKPDDTPKYNHESHDSHEEHHNHHDEHEHQEPHSTTSEPAAESHDNGYVVVNGGINKAQEDMSRILEEFGSNLEHELKAAASQKVYAEADSSTSHDSAPLAPSAPSAPPSPPSPPAASSSNKDSSSCSSSSTNCSVCPYYLLASKCVKSVEVPPKVRDLLLWKNPNYTGIVFGLSLVLLISLATFSLLTVVGSVMLLAMVFVGAYRLYLAVMFYIKGGQQDETFSRLASCDCTLPKEKMDQLFKLLEADVNKVLNQTKAIILWDNILISGVALLGFYVIYTIGSVFNILTLIILVLVISFTLPKAFQMYKNKIDEGLKKSISCLQTNIKKILAKMHPFVKKFIVNMNKKIQ